MTVHALTDRTSAPTRTVPALLAGGLAGLVAALAMTLVLLLLRLGLGISPPPEMIPDRLAPMMSIEQLFALIGWFGGYDELKQFGVGSFLAGQLVVGTLLGALYPRFAGDAGGTAVAGGRGGSTGAPGRRGLTFAALVVLVAWVATIALVWPVLGTSFRGLPPGTARIVTALGLLVAYGTYGAVFLLAYRAIVASSRPTAQLANGAAGASGAGRRAVIVGGVGLALAAASGLLLRRLYHLATFAYDGTRFWGPLTPITPTNLFYVVTKNVIDPRVVPALWRLEIGGMVERPRTHGFEELAALPATTQQTTLMCISNGVGDGLMSNAEWTGVPLGALLEQAGPRPGVVEVLLHGADGYTDTFPLEKALDPTTLVVYAMNGEPLTENHGYPVRVIVPGLFGEKNVKWVTRIELVDRDVKGFYEQQGWGPDFVIPTRSRFFEPDFEQPIQAGAPVTLRGIVFAGDRGVSRAEVSLDDGQTWQDAPLEYPGTQLSWAIWRYRWQPRQPGEYRLVVRGFDGTGAPQPAEDVGIVPSGGRGYHRVAARVV